MSRYEYQKKITDIKQLKDLVDDAKCNNQTIVFTNGCFDIIHRGHVDYLRRSKQLGDLLIIGLNSDESVRRLKGSSRPINNEQDRSFVLEALDFVDYIVVFNDDTPIELILKLKPDIYTKGGDYDLNNVIGPKLGADIVENYGGKVVLLKTVDGYSTTNVINKGGI